MATKKQTASQNSLSDGSVTLTFKVSAKDVAKAYKEVVLEYASSAEIKGFRKGKAPLAMVEKSLDKQKIISHVIEHVIPPAYSKAVEGAKLLPLIDPRLTPISMEEGKDWEFKAEIATRPDINLGSYKTYIAKALKSAKNTQQKLKKPTDNWQLTTVFDSLLREAKIAVAPILVDTETKTQLSKLVKQLSALKLSLEDYLKSIKKTEEALIAEYKESAETNLKLEFILSEIIKDYDPKVTEEEVKVLKPEKNQESYARYLVQKRKTLDFLCAL